MGRADIDMMISVMGLMFGFYCVGWIIGILINLRFMLPRAYFEIKEVLVDGLSMWWMIIRESRQIELFDLVRVIFDTVRAIVFFLFVILLGSCVAFFVSWVSVGYFMLNYSRLKEEIEQISSE